MDEIEDTSFADKKQYLYGLARRSSNLINAMNKMVVIEASELQEIEVFYPNVRNYIKNIECVMADAKSLLDDFIRENHVAQNMDAEQQTAKNDVELVPVAVADKHFGIFGIEPENFVRDAWQRITPIDSSPVVVDSLDEHHLGETAEGDTL